MSKPESRTTKSARNIAVSILAQVVFVALGFMTRTIFVTQLGVALIGVNSLLTSVLAMLALADLGINGAVMYALYQPLRDGDTNRTAAIVQYAARLFRWVALVVAVLGLGITPFIHLLVRLEEDVELLEVYFLVLLANTVVTYLMQNRVILLNADQRIHTVKTYSMIFNLLRSLAQIIVLLMLSSFLLFLVIQVVFTMTNNVVVYLRAGRIYPYLKRRTPRLERKDRRTILGDTRAMLMYRVGNLALNNATPVMISVLVGTMTLGYYANYMLIIGAAIMITEVVFLALAPSVGNLVASGDREAQRRVFDSVTMISVLVHGFIAVGVVALVDDFMLLWLGNGYALSDVVVVFIVINFYVAATVRPLWSFLTATGLFRRTRLMMLVTAATSIALAIGLGALFGLVGIVIAPAIAQLLLQAWYEPRTLVREHLPGKLLPYYRLHVTAFVLWSMIALVLFIVGCWIPGGPLMSVFVKAGLLLVLFPFVSWLAFGRTQSFQSVVQRFAVLSKQIGRGLRGKPSD